MMAIENIVPYIFFFSVTKYMLKACSKIAFALGKIWIYYWLS